MNKIVHYTSYDDRSSPCLSLKIGSLYCFTTCHVTLPHEPLLVRTKGAHDAMQYAAVVKKHQIALAPIVSVDKARSNGGSLQAMYNATHLGQVVDDHPRA